MRKEKHMSVAEYLADQIEQSPKTQLEISEEAGFEKPNIITMLKQGKTKIPLTRVGPLATALGINPRHLMRRVLEEYAPETWHAFEQSLGHLVLSYDEEQLVLTSREMSIPS